MDPAPLPIYGTLFESLAASGAGDAAPLPIYGTLFSSAAASIDLQPGYLDLAGQSLTLRRSRLFALDYGTLTFAGQDLTLTPSAYTGGVSGVGPLPVYGSLFELQTGNYIMTMGTGRLTPAGQAITFDLGKGIELSPGVLTLRVAYIERDMDMTMSPDALTLSGPEQPFERPRALLMSPGTLTLQSEWFDFAYDTGTDKRMPMGAGRLTLSSPATTFDVGRGIDLGTGTLYLIGKPIRGSLYASLVATQAGNTVVAVAVNSNDDWTDVDEQATSWQDVPETTTEWN